MLRKPDSEVWSNIARDRERLAANKHRNNTQIAVGLNKIMSDHSIYNVKLHCFIINRCLAASFLVVLVPACMLTSIDVMCPGHHRRLRPFQSIQSCAIERPTRNHHNNENTNIHHRKLGNDDNNPKSKSVKLITNSELCKHGSLRN